MLMGIAAVALFITLSVRIGVQIARYARSDEGWLAILKTSFWFLTVSTCCYFWTLVVLFVFGHYPRSILLVLIPFAALICATIGMGLSIVALNEKIAFAKLPDPDQPARREFQARHRRLTRMAARVIVLFALLLFENFALNYFIQLRTDADLAYKKMMIDSREDAVKHSLAKIRSAIELKSESPATIRHSLAHAQQSTDGLL